MTAAAVILFIGAAFSLFFTCLAAAIDGESSDSSDAVVLLFISLLGAALNVFLASFLLKGRNWARILTLVLGTFSLLISLSVVVTDLSGCVGILINGAVILLLFSDSARQYCR